jgi:uncharacterized protein (TIGR03067 family)
MVALRGSTASMTWRILFLPLSFGLLIGCNESPDADQEKRTAEEPIAKPDPPEKTTFGEEELQGTWKVIEATDEGKPRENAIGIEYTFASGILLIRRPDRETPERHAYEIDVTQDPPHLDLILNLFGTERRLPGIFEIRNGDLAWYSAGSAFPRPKTFTAESKGYSYYLLQPAKRVFAN